MSDLSDSKIIADFRCRFKRMARGMAVYGAAVLIYVFAISAFAGWADAHDWFARTGIRQGWLYVIELLPILIANILLLGRKEPRLQDLPERVLRKQIDHYQRRWRGVVLFLLAGLVVTAVSLSLLQAFTGMFSHHDTIVVDAAVAGVLFIVVALSCALAAVFYPGLKVFDDERIKALRAGSAKAGFTAVILALGIAFPAALLHPEWTVQAFIGVLLVGGAAPALYYVIADWRASRDG